VSTLRETSPGVWQNTPLLQAATGLATFGQDVDGELYLVTGNDVWKLVSDAPVSVPASAPSATVILALALFGLGVLSIRRRRLAAARA
jgi:hypothetical protein